MPAPKTTAPHGRIVVFSTAEMPVDADPTNLNLRTWRAIAEAFERVDVVTRAAGGSFARYAFGPVVVTTLPRGRGPLRHAAFVIRALTYVFRSSDLRQARVFIGADPLGAGFAAVAAARLRRGRAVVELLGQLLDLPAEHRSVRRWMIPIVSRAVLRRASIVRVCAMTFVRDVEQAGVPLSRIVYVPSRVDPGEFAPPDQPRSEFRARLGLPRDHLAVVFAGTFNTSKGIDTLAEAVELVRDGELIFVIAGDGPLRRVVLALSEQNPERVRYLGRLPHSRMRDLFCAADLVVQPSRDEGQPRTVLEAMSCRTPVVATAVGGIPEIVQPGLTGVLVPPNDPTALAQAIEALLADRDYRDVLGNAARSFVCAHHGFEDGIARLQELYAV
jgi:glycosyltransferase involved in cell wall biosynthesis